MLRPGDPDAEPTGSLVCDTPLEEWLLDTECPYPLWPAPGSLMTWGLDANENAFFWSMRGDDPDAWPVVVREGGSFTADGFREFPPGMAGLLLTAFGDAPPRPFGEGFCTAIRAMVFRTPGQERRMRAQGLDPCAAPAPEPGPTVRTRTGRTRAGDGGLGRANRWRLVFDVHAARRAGPGFFRCGHPLRPPRRAARAAGNQGPAHIGRSVSRRALQGEYLERLCRRKAAVFLAEHDVRMCVPVYLLTVARRHDSC